MMTQEPNVHRQMTSIDDVIDAMILRQKPPHIVLADDEPEMRTLLAAPLRDDGYEVVEARDGIELVRAIHRFEMWMLPLGLIITDVRMPGFTGLETLEYLNSEGFRVPVIVMTAFGDIRTHAEAKELGARMVLDKPLCVDHLRATVAEILPRALC